VPADALVLLEAGDSHTAPESRNVTQQRAEQQSLLQDLLLLSLVALFNAGRPFMSACDKEHKK
jgi:hypothetical protein